MLGFEEELSCVVIGASGGVGQAFTEALAQSRLCKNLVLTSRNPAQTPSSVQNSKVFWQKLDVTDEQSIQNLGLLLKEKEIQPNLILNLSGVLHTSDFGPEKTWRHLNMETMQRVFAVNTFGVALLAKHLIPLIPRKGRSIFATLSARVGSISDNRLGGWYSYRSSKAAQNMMIKTVSIEAARKWKELICVALHPGTVETNLSRPFTKHYDPKKLFSPEKSCGLLSDVLSGLTVENTGGFFAWDGSKIDY